MSQISVAVATLLALAGCLMVSVMTPSPKVLAAQPETGGRAIVHENEKAHREALELLQRYAARKRPDWMVVATAGASGWEFTILSTRKALALANPREDASAPLPPLDALVLPHRATVEANLTSNTDIHPFVVPGLGIDRTALPGRLERVAIDTAKLGVFASTCPDPCNAAAKAMSFTVHIVDFVMYLRWMDAREAASAKPTRQ
jgi:heme/copper-type cytochrome/quinol oxidase subunit 2